MDINVVFGFIAVSFALAMTPGADWAYAISAGLGRHRVTSAVAGLCGGYVLHTLLLAAGMAALISSMPQLLSWITLVGAAYLIWLGIGTTKSWRRAGFSSEDGPAHERPRGGRSVTTTPELLDATDTRLLLRTIDAATTEVPERFFGPAFFRGLGTSGTNPKALLLYLALIPQFIHADASLPVTAQTAILGLSHMLLSMGIYSVVALGARLLLRQRPTAARIITLCSGLVMILLGLVLVAEQAPGLLEIFGSLVA